MKKLALVVVSMFVLSGVAFSGEINLKVEADVYEGIKEKFSGEEPISLTPKTGFALAGEYLVPVNNSFKLGAGLEYAFPRNNGDKKIDKKFSYFPVYFTTQINPISSAQGVFLKGNVGYTLFFSDMEKVWDEKKTNIKLSVTNKGGLYYAFGAGYEFPFGLILDVTYSHYITSEKVKLKCIDYIDDVQPMQLLKNFDYRKVGINVGYKFKL